MRFTQEGKKVCRFSIAVNEKYKERESTEWWQIVAFDKTAEICHQYLAKGSTVWVDGKPQLRKWQDREGADKLSFSLIANKIIFFSTKRAGDSAPEDDIQRSPGEDYADKRADPAQDSVFPSDSDIPF